MIPIRPFLLLAHPGMLAAILRLETSRGLPKERALWTHVPGMGAVIRRIFTPFLPPIDPWRILWEAIAVWRFQTYQERKHVALYRTRGLRKPPTGRIPVPYPLSPLLGLPLLLLEGVLGVAVRALLRLATRIPHVTAFLAHPLRHLTPPVFEPPRPAIPLSGSRNLFFHVASKGKPRFQGARPWEPFRRPGLHVGKQGTVGREPARYASAVKYKPSGNLNRFRVPGWLSCRRSGGNPHRGPTGPHDHGRNGGLEVGLHGWIPALGAGYYLDAVPYPRRGPACVVQAMTFFPAYGSAP